MLGTSGTVTTLAAVLLGLPRYDRRVIDGLRVDPDAIVAVSRRLRAHGQRRAAPRIPASARVAPISWSPAARSWRRCCACWPVASLRVADRGLREGMLHGLMGRTLGAGAGTRPGHPGRPAGSLRPVACSATRRPDARARVRPGRARGCARPRGAASLRPAGSRVTSATPTCSARARRAIARARPTSCSRSTRSTACSSPAGACSTWAARPAAGCRWRSRRGARVVGVDLDEVAPVGGAVVLQGDIFDEEHP